jgi:hypothetical protein
VSHRVGLGSGQERVAKSSISPRMPAGETRYFQLWYHDSAGGPWGYSLSDGLEITFCP